MGFYGKTNASPARVLSMYGRSARARPMAASFLTWKAGFVIAEANRIFGFDGWNRETIESRCVLARENRGTFVAVYVAKVRITVHADGATVIREGHGSGEGRGASPGEVHDIALKAAETDATKRALATFGKPFGLELYRQSRTTRALPISQPTSGTYRPNAVRLPPLTIRPQFPGRPGTMAVVSRQPITEHFKETRTACKRDISSSSAACAGNTGALSGQDRQKRSHAGRTQASSRQVASALRGLTALSRLRPASLRSSSPTLCATKSLGRQSQ